MPELLKKLGFDVVHSVLGGYSKFVHPSLEIEFLIPKLGRGKSTPYKVTSLRVTAQGLRYIGLADQYSVEMSYKGLKVRVPEPAAFVLLKFLTSEKRKNLPKRERDVSTAVQLAEFLLTDPTQADKLKEIWSSLPKKWQSTVLRIVRNTAPPLYELLQSE